MAASDVPGEAMEAAVDAMVAVLGSEAPTRNEDRDAIRVILAAAAPHMHTDCGCAAACVAKPGIRAQVLAEVDAALRDRKAAEDWLEARGSSLSWWSLLAADYLRDTLGAGGDGEG